MCASCFIINRTKVVRPLSLGFTDILIPYKTRFFYKFTSLLVAPRQYFSIGIVHLVPPSVLKQCQSKVAISGIPHAVAHHILVKQPPAFPMRPCSAAPSIVFNWYSIQCRTIKMFLCGLDNSWGRHFIDFPFFILSIVN